MKTTTTTYLIPTIWNMYAPIVYRYEKRKKDMRTVFCKKYRKYTTTDCILISISKEYIDNGYAKINGNTLVFKNGAKAILFFKEMKEGGWYK